MTVELEKGINLLNTPWMSPGRQTDESPGRVNCQGRTVSRGYVNESFDATLGFFGYP